MKSFLRILSAALLAAFCEPVWAQQPAATTAGQGYWYRHPTSPNVLLGANDDGSNTVKINLTFGWDYVSGARGEGWGPVHGISFVPTFSATDNTKQSLVIVGAPGDTTPPSGSAIFTFGLMGAYTNSAAFHADEVDALPTFWVIQPGDVEKCDKVCAQIGDAGNCKTYRDLKTLVEQSHTAVDVPRVFTAKTLCDAARGDVDARWSNALKGSTKLVRAMKNNDIRMRFPFVDASLWGGAGGSRFTFYQEQSMEMGTTLPTYATTSQWDPNGGVAFELSMLPWINEDDPKGITVEAMFYFDALYQANSASGAGCTGSLGTVTSDKFPAASLLAQCGATQPIGGPTFGTDLVMEGYVGWAELEHSYGRFAVGGGMDQNFGKSLTTWSFKVPLYINGTAAAKGSDTDGSNPPPAAGGVPSFTYDGIVRLTPTVMYTRDPTGRKEGWGFVVTANLIGNHNLFLRADSLVK